MHPQTTPLDPLYRVVLSAVRADTPDLTQRQLAVLMTVGMTDGPHTVRSLAEALNVHKPAITRALDRLHEHGLAQRKADPRDRRSVLASLTAVGAGVLAQMRSDLEGE